MKKISVLCLSAILIMGALSGCGDKIVRPTKSPDSSAVSLQSPAAEQDNYPVELSSSEIADFQNAFAEYDNYGFLLSDYDDVRDADLYQVFYTGAGMNDPENSEEIIDAYLASICETELFCDCTILTTQQLDDFLVSKTGYTLSEMNNSFSWEYVEAYDAYVHQHGDTNYMTATCTGGRALGQDLYEIDYSFDGGIYDDDGNLFSGGTVTVNTSGVALQFVSNSLSK